MTTTTNDLDPADVGCTTKDCPNEHEMNICVICGRAKENSAFKDDDGVLWITCSVCDNSWEICSNEEGYLSRCGRMACSDCTREAACEHHAKMLLDRFAVAREEIRWPLSELGNPLHPCPGCGTPIAFGEVVGGGLLYTVDTIDGYDNIDILFCSPCGDTIPPISENAS